MVVEAGREVNRGGQNKIASSTNKNLVIRKYLREKTIKDPPTALFTNYVKL